MRMRIETKTITTDRQKQNGRDWERRAEAVTTTPRPHSQHPPSFASNAKCGEGAEKKEREIGRQGSHTCPIICTYTHTHARGRVSLAWLALMVFG